MSNSKKDRQKVLDTLAELSDEQFQEDDITYEGSKLVVPEKMSAREAISTLEDHLAQMETKTSFLREFKARPWDGAAAFERAVKRVTGTVGIQKGTSSFFGTTPPYRVTINTGPDTTMDVPWGNIEIGLFDAVATVGVQEDEELGQMFVISMNAPRKHRAAIEGLFQVVQDELDQRSIYRGQAFNGKDDPDFLDLSGVDPTQVVYSAEVIEQLDANIWSLIEYTDVQREQGLPLKRSVLLHGPYGTGKTLAAYLTAQRAVENDWTFIYCRPGKDELNTVMQTARLYQPAVVFFEDVDIIADGTDGRDGVSQLLDTFDGVTAKGTELAVVMTTNHPDRIHQGMLRPGRLDSVIEIGALDSPGVRKLIEATVPERLITSEVVTFDEEMVEYHGRESHLDWDAIGVAMEGFMPAFVKEAIDRTIRYAITRTGGAPKTLETEDFVQSAEGMRTHLSMMEDASNEVAVRSLGRVLQETVEEAVIGKVMQYDEVTGLDTIRPNPKA